MNEINIFDGLEGEALEKAKNYFDEKHLQQDQKEVMTIQQLCDQLTSLCHEGHAQAQIKIVSGFEVKNVTGIEFIGKEHEVAVIKSEEL